MSQVKNLRAMFEQKGDSSPPDRGREGLPSTPTDSPRPLSRVRTSFVTVEKDGRVGLQRDTSSDSVPTLSRTLSAGTESDVAVPGVPLSPARSRSPIKLEDSKPAPTTQTPQRMPAPIPEESTPVTPTKAPLPVSSAKPVREATPKPQPSAEVKVSAPTPVPTNKDETSKSPSKSLDAKATQRDKSPTPTPRKLFAKAAEGESALGTPKKTLDAPTPASNGVKKATNVPKGGLSSQPAPPAAARTNGATNGVAKDAPVTGSSRSAASTSSHPLHPKIGSTGSGSKEAHKPIATSAGKSAPKAIATVRDSTKPAAKSPGLAVKSPTVKTPKTPTSPAKPTTAKTTATKATTTTASKPTTTSKLPSKKPSSATTAATAPKLTAGSKSSSSTTGAKKPAAVQTFPSNGIGFVKPKVKSPTRPVQLPSSLTTHTASSATKAGVPRPSLSRQSGNFLTLHQPASSASAVRSPSRTSTSSAAAAGPRTLRRQSSTVSRPRPSIGPPPKQTARDHPVTRKEKEVDEGFLARMMRPTQASALKTADKAQLSPPRKQPVAAHVAAVPIATKTARKSSAHRESAAATATGKKAAPEPPSLANRPPACITRNPDFPPPTTVAESVKETVPNPYAAPAAKETEPVKEAPVEEEERVEEDVVEEEQADEEAVDEEPIEEVAEEEDAPAVAEVQDEVEDEAEDESHVESVEEVVKEEGTDEPESAPPTEAASEKKEEGEENEDAEGEDAKEAKAAVEDSDTSAV